MVNFLNLNVSAVSYLRQDLIPSLTERQKKVALAVLSVFLLLCTAYFIARRYFFKAAPIQQDGTKDTGAVRDGQSIQDDKKAIGIVLDRELLIDEIGTHSGKSRLRIKVKNQGDETYEEILKTDPDNVEALIDYGISLSEQRKFSKAEAYFGQAIIHDPNNIDALNQQARCMLRQNKNDKAADQFEEVLKLGPRNAFALTGYAEALLKQGKTAEAHQEISKALKIDLLNPWTLFVGADVCFALGQHNEAKENYVNAMKYTKMENIYGQLMRLYKDGKTQVATYLCIELCNLNNGADYKEQLQRFADKLREDKKFDDAATIFDGLLIKFPNDPFCLSRYGVVLFGQGKKTEAMQKLADARSVGSDDKVTLLGIAECLISCGVLELADGILIKVLDLDPHHVQALNLHSYIRSEQGYLDEAVEQFNEVIAREPDNIYALSHLGEVLYKQQHFVESKKIFEKVLTIDPQNLITFQYLALLSGIKI